jgi:nanoRNase/pAp phosphatase (c-di-AMP/oligoRNAs hydrolase)
MFFLPVEKWARRLSGVVGNELANQYPDRVHAILTENKKLTELGESTNNEKTYQVSLRAPKNKLEGADEIAMKFGGGGRKGAAGIDILTSSSLNELWYTLAL